MIPLLSIRSRNTEADGTSTQVLQSYKGTGLNSDPNMEKIMNPLEAKSQLLNAAIGRTKEKSEQKTNDEVRDEKISGLYFLLLSFSHHPDAQISEAAQSLLAIFNHYGLEIKDESFTRESSLLNSMLADFNKTKALEAIALVPQCAEYIAALQQAQDIFEDSRLAFESAQAQEGTLENATQLKKEVIEQVNNLLVPYLNVMVQLDEETYGTYARVVSELISTNNEVVNKRRNQKNQEGDTPEEEE